MREFFPYPFTFLAIFPKMPLLQRLEGVVKLILVFLFAFCVHANKIHVDMYTPLLLAGLVLVVFVFLNPDDPHIQTLNHNMR